MRAVLLAYLPIFSPPYFRLHLLASLSPPSHLPLTSLSPPSRLPLASRFLPWQIQRAPVEEAAKEVLANLVSELSVLRACRGLQDEPNGRTLVEFLGAACIGPDVYFLMEHASGGDLRMALARNPSPGFGERYVQCVV